MVFPSLSPFAGPLVGARQPTRSEPPLVLRVQPWMQASSPTITRWARQGYLPAHPLGEGKRKFWRFIESELSEWLEAKSNRPATS